MWNQYFDNREARGVSYDNRDSAPRASSSTLAPRTSATDIGPVRAVPHLRVLNMQAQPMLLHDTSSNATSSWRRPYLAQTSPNRLSCRVHCTSLTSQCDVLIVHHCVNVTALLRTPKTIGDHTINILLHLNIVNVHLPIGLGPRHEAIVTHLLP